VAEAANDSYPPDEPSRLLLRATIKALHDWRERRHVPESVTTEELADAGEMARIMLKHGNPSSTSRWSEAVRGGSAEVAAREAGMEFDPPDSLHEDDGVEPEELEALRAEIRARRETLPAGPL
jgi:hypothetical protein